MEHKLAEKEEESRFKAREIKKLLFAHQKEEARFLEELADLRSQVAPPFISSLPPLSAPLSLL